MSTADSTQTSVVVETIQNHASSQPPSKLTCDQLLAALDAQIKFTADERRRDGWTHWAIGGALATMVWLGIGLVCLPEFSLRQATFLAMEIFAVWRLIELAVAFLSPPAAINVSQTRFRIFADLVSAERLQLAFGMLLHCTIICGLWLFCFHGMSSLWIYAVLALACNMLIFGYGRLPFALPTNPTAISISISASSFILIALLLCVAIQLGYDIKNTLPMFNSTEVRIAILICAAVHLLNCLVSDSSTKPLLNKLQQIRQDLAFGRITLEEATRHSDVTLSGLKLVDVLNPAVNLIFTKADELQSMCERLGKSIDEANGRVHSIRSDESEPEANNDHEAKIIRLIDQLDSELKNVAAKKSELIKAATKFELSSRVIVMFTPESRPEVENIAKSVSNTIGSARQKELEFSIQLDKLKKSINELVPNLGSGF